MEKVMIGISTRIQGVSMSGYDGGCERCELNKGSQWSMLPTIVNTDELYFHGFLCEDCEKILNDSKEERLKFIQTQTHSYPQWKADVPSKIPSRHLTLEMLTEALDLVGNKK